MASPVSYNFMGANSRVDPSSIATMVIEGFKRLARQIALFIQLVKDLMETFERLNKFIELFTMIDKELDKVTETEAEKINLTVSNDFFQ